MPLAPDPTRLPLEHQMVTDALAALQNATGLQATFLRDKAMTPDVVGDAEVKIGTGPPLVVECRRQLRPANLGMLVAPLKRAGYPVLLVTEHVNPAMAERLKEMEVQFLDTVGNAYVQTPELLIFIVGRKPQRKPPAQQPVRAFRPTGLKAIFALLCLPELVNQPYRVIADQAGVALGTVNAVMKDLERMDYLRETKALGRRIEKPRDLQTAWVEGYLRNLRPRLNPRRYRVAQTVWWKTEDIWPDGIFLGGEPAAAVLVEHLIPEVATIYDHGGFAALAKTLRPAKDAGGNLEVLDRFWTFDAPETLAGIALVPPLLIYADLLGTADARNLETAELVRERFLA